MHLNNAAIVKHKAAACLVRLGARGPELLVFRHPLAGVQIPKGSVEAGETAADAAVRRTILTAASGLKSSHCFRCTIGAALATGGSIQSSNAEYSDSSVADRIISSMVQHRYLGRKKEVLYFQSEIGRF